MSRSYTHDELSERALRWFGSRVTPAGGRGGFEVKVTDHYVADVATLGFVQNSYVKEYESYWGLKQYTLRREYNRNKNGEFDVSYEVRGDFSAYFACIFESKTTRSDYLHTFGKNTNRLEPVAHLHFIVTTKGIVKLEEVPKFWGLLILVGNGLAQIKMPEYCAMNQEKLNSFAHRLLWAKPRGTRKHKGEIPKQLRIPDL